MTFSAMLSLAFLGQAWPGSDLSLAEAREKADVIVVATPGNADVHGSGAAAFFEVDLREVVVLKGRLEVTVLKRASGRATGREIVPRAGKEYVVFLDRHEGHLNILKVLPATEENIESVKREIREPGSGRSRVGIGTRLSSSLRRPSPRASSSSGSPAPRPSVVDHLLFHPSPFPQGNWSIDESKFEDAWFRSTNGARLNGWFAEARNPRAVVLFTEGNGGNITYRRDVLTLFRDRLNRSVLIFDYQGYGKSEGKPTREGILDDARAARRWLAEKTGVAEREIVLVGESLGGAVAVDLAARDGARGLVLQSTFSSLSDVTRQHFGRMAGRIVTNQLDSATLIRDYQGPLLQTHGDADTLVPFAQGRRLFEAANEPKRFVAVPGGGHNDPPSPEYLESLDRFLDKLPARNSTHSG